MNKIYKFDISEYKDDPYVLDDMDRYIGFIKNPPSGCEDLAKQYFKRLLLGDIDISDEDFLEAFIKDYPEVLDANKVNTMNASASILKKLFPDSKIKIEYNEDYADKKMGLSLIKTGSGNITMTVKHFGLYSKDAIDLFRLVLKKCENYMEICVDDKNRLQFIFEFKNVCKKIR